MSSQKSEMSDRGFLVLTMALGTAVAWLRYKVQIVSFIVNWRIAVAMAITLGVIACLIYLRGKIQAKNRKHESENEIITPVEGEDCLFAGLSTNGKNVYVKQPFRKMHTQVVGTTNAGKTESVILPWAIDDIKKGRGLLIIDGKSDMSLLNKLYAYAKRHHRENDVRVLSLCNVGISHTFNPLSGGSALEITERVFSAFNFESEYFKSIQYDVFLHLLLILEAVGIKPTPLRMIECMRSEKALADLAVASKTPRLQVWAGEFLKLNRDEREQRTSGLVAQLQSFAVGETSQVFNTEISDINLEQALEHGEIIYCQLPALKIPTLGKATGKMILQCLQSAVSSRHLGKYENPGFFSVYLDDFTEYLTPSFVTLLNKSRSANVGVVFAHQALGDLDGLGDGVKNTILTNSNLKVFMRTNEPESAEYFSSVIGTIQGSKVTERQTEGLFGSEKTGDGSVREVEEFKYHPNVFKQELGVGEAVMVLPHAKGSLPVRLKFKKSFDLDVPQIPLIQKSEPTGLPKLENSAPANQPQTPVRARADVMTELTQERKAA